MQVLYSFFTFLSFFLGKSNPSEKNSLDWCVKLPFLKNMQKNKFLFLIRAYNEKSRIEGVIESIFKEGYHHVLVVDDGSTDGTSQILQE
jgi:cellulose synthase/poly-beta-1,6-N-acetylglucosamine synthase-like glycosyltransferase